MNVTARQVFLIAFAALAVASFVLSMFVPLYTDEIVWKAMQGRMGIDDFHNVGLLATCEPHAIPTPLLLRPFYLIDTAIYQDMAQPGLIRIAGGVLALVWGVLAWVLLRRALRPTVSSGAVALGVVGFATLGVMPFLLTMSRPEQILLIAVTALAIPLLNPPPRGQRTLLNDALVAVALVFGSGYVLAAHPRGTTFLPLMLLFLVCFVARKSIMAVAGAAILVIAKVALADWSLRPMCMEPSLRLAMVKDNILVAIKEGELGYYLHALGKILPQPYFYFLSQFQLIHNYTSDMYPVAPYGVQWTIGGVSTIAFGLLVICGLIAFLIAIPAGLRDRARLVPLLTLASLWGVYVFSMIARVPRNTYESTLMEPLLALAAVGSIWTIRDRIAGWLGPVRAKRAAATAFGVLLALSVANQVTLLTLYVPYAAGSWTDPGYAKGQRFSVTSFGYEGLQRKILATAKLCGIDPANNPKNLVVDELTYFAMRTSPTPFFGTYVDEQGWAAGVADIRKELARQHSGGMIVGCQWVPSGMRAEVIEHGGFCCMGAFTPTEGREP